MSQLLFTHKTMMHFIRILDWSSIPLSIIENRMPTLTAGADPENFGGGNAVLNYCRLNVN